MNDITKPKGPLTGLLVLDFTCYVSGPACTQMLYDNGARVIKLERAGIGEPVRVIAPFVDVGDKKIGTMACAYNGGKESILADFKNPDDVNFLKRIIKKADIVVENFRPGVMARAGLDYDSVKDLNPSLIYASISGFGQTGPMHGDAAFDAIIQGASGLMSSTGERGGDPLMVGSSVADVVTGIQTYGAIMTACFDREKTGQGCHIDSTMLESVSTLLCEPLIDYSATGKPDARHGNESPDAAPFGAYATATREILICVASFGQWKVFCETLGKKEWLDMPEYAWPASVLKNKDKFRKDLEAVLTTQDHNYWLEKLGATGTPVGLVNTMAEAMDSEQHKHRKYFVKTAGNLYNGNPISLSTYTRITERPDIGEVGECNDEIRKEFAN